jgi:Kef-type K+ transport system membrane component KefB
VKLHQDRYRGWFVIFLVGNIMVLLAVGLWRPSTGFDVFNFQHVRLIVLAAFNTSLAAAISAAGLLLRRHHGAMLCAAALFQVLALIPAIYALGPWPGGDDGPRMGWEGIVIPGMGLLALAGIIASLFVAVHLFRKN